MADPRYILRQTEEEEIGQVKSTVGALAAFGGKAKGGAGGGKGKGGAMNLLGGAAAAGSIGDGKDKHVSGEVVMPKKNTDPEKPLPKKPEW